MDTERTTQAPDSHIAARVEDVRRRALEAAERYAAARQQFNPQLTRCQKLDATKSAKWGRNLFAQAEQLVQVNTDRAVYTFGCALNKYEWAIRQMEDATRQRFVPGLTARQHLTLLPSLEPAPKEEDEQKQLDNREKRLAFAHQILIREARCETPLPYVRGWYSLLTEELDAIHRRHMKAVQGVQTQFLKPALDPHAFKIL